MPNLTIATLYAQLLAAYGPQGWWPLAGLAADQVPPCKTGSRHGYHPGDYSWPRTPQQRFEVGVGAILTQNTAWTNAEQAITQLLACQALTPAALLELPDASLEQAIRPAGYFRVKARKLRIFAEFFHRLDGQTPTRQQLLGVWGIGPETADSILLYAYGRPHMVIDTYTRRILLHLQLVPATDSSYDQLQQHCLQALPPEVSVFQEFHALLVEHAKRHYRRVPYLDPLATGPPGPVTSYQ